MSCYIVFMLVVMITKEKEIAFWGISKDLSDIV